MKSVHNVVLGVSFALIVAVSASAQITEVKNTTSTPVPGSGHDYLGILNETTNPANGSVSLRIQMPVPPGRGIILPFSINYNSSSAHFLTFLQGVNTWNSDDGIGVQAPYRAGGWTYSVPRLTWANVVGTPGCTYDYFADYVFYDADGGSHNLALANGVTLDRSNLGCNDGGLPPVLNGGDEFYQATAVGISGGAVHVSSLDGAVYGFNGTPQSALLSTVQDRNGNIINFKTTSGAGFTVTDTLNRPGLSASGFGNNGDTISVSGISQSYTLSWESVPSNFSLAGNLLGGPPATGSCPSFPVSNNHSLLVIKSITLPDGNQYQFSYDPTYGALTQITYPTGAWIKYTYQINPLSEVIHFSGGQPQQWGIPPPPAPPNPTCWYSHDWYSLKTRDVSVDGTNVVLHQDFSYSTSWNLPTNFQGWTGKQTTVTTHDLVTNQISTATYIYTPNYVLGNDPLDPNLAGTGSPIPTESIITYKDNGGKVFETVTKDWNGPNLLASEQKSLSNGLTSKRAYQYFYSLPTEVDEYGFGSGGNAGPLLRQTKTTYASFANNSTVLDRPSSVTVYDGGGHPVSATVNCYDQNTPTATTGIVQHGVPGVPNLPGVGNLTQHLQWLNPPGGTNPLPTCQTGASSSALSTSYTYDDTGQVLSMTDPNGNPTKYSYTDSYTEGTAPGTTNAYVTTITHPKTGNVSQVENFSYAYADGQLTKRADENNQTTSFQHADVLRRLTEIDFADGGKKTYDYHNDTLPLTVTQTVLATPDPSIISSTIYDNLARVATTSLDSDPLGPDLVDFAYDGQGHKLTESNPHRSAAALTDGITTYVYDAIDRVTQVIKPDSSQGSSVVNFAYEQPATVLTTSDCTTTTDEAENPRRSCSDGLGRLVEVDEPTGGAPPTPGTGSATVSGIEGSAQVVNTPATSGTGSVQLSGAVQWKAVASASTGGTTKITISGTEQQKPKGVTPGTGAVTVSTATNGEQVIPATYATGSVTINGSLQSKQVLTQAATPSSASVSVSGLLASVEDCNWDSANNVCGQPNDIVYDAGTSTLTVNGCAITTGWESIAITTASDLVGYINASSCSPVNASPANSTGTTAASLTITSKASGASTNYGLSTSSADAGPQPYIDFRGNSTTYNFGCCSFDLTAPSGMSGGKDAVYVTVYDSGTCTITANQHGDTSSTWSGSGTTAAGIASDLVGKINNDTAAFVRASLSGSTVNLTALAPGAVGNYTLSSSCTYDTSNFPGPSFTTSNSGSTLTGGKNEIDDTGTVTVTVNNHPDSASWGKGDTVNSIAQNLAASINKDTAISGVTASASGATITLTSVALGTIGNYPLSVSPPTYDSAHFSQSSFTVSGSGTALTGGWPNPNAVDNGTMTIKVNSTSYQVSWGQSDTPGTIAGKLLSALGADPTVIPTLSGSTTIYLDPKQPGTSYSFSTAYTYDSGDFTQSSFSTSNSISDYGTSTIAVNGHNDSVQWAGHDTPSSLASALGNMINGDSGAAANATASGNTVSLTARSTGVQSNYTLASSTAYDTAHFSATSFSSSNSGTTLAGGVNATYKTVYDSGTVTLSMNGTNYSVTYGQTDTTATISKNLAAALNAGGLANAEVSGSTVNFKADASSASTNYSLSSSSASSQPGVFSTPSFSDSPSGSAMTGGANAVPGSLTNPLVTIYGYDALGNLLNVQQRGGTTDQTQWRPRSFSYDSLSRLLAASNPESGTISYSYDADGNLLYKTSPAPNQNSTATITVSYCYDPLNRVLAKGYSNPNPQQCTGTPPALPSPAVTYTYDQGGQAAYAIGRLTSLTDPAGSAAYQYDQLGRILNEQRTIAGISNSMSYSYNLAGALKNLTYPSKAVVAYTPDGAGHDVSAIDTGNTINYATSAAYGPDGSLTGFVSGSSSSFAGITSSFSFNKRLQPIFMSAASPAQTVFSIGYDFHLGAGDNGNVYALTNNKDTTRNQSFTYDTLNRLISAENSGTDCSQTTLNPNQTKYWGNNYGYDAWGNLLAKTVTKCSAENLSVTASANNQLSGYGYDAAGNMTHDSTSGLNYSYDQENRITAAGGFTYTYDADGNRVEKSNGSTGTLYWYMTPGIVAESNLAGNLQSEYVFFDGERIARKDFPSNAVSYYFSDHLKTTDIVTDALGNIKNESDFNPWGGEFSFSANDSNHYKFTGKERDTETGLDYFGARYYSNGLGRFITPDWSATPVPVPYADLGDPQTLNEYSYVRNIPTVKVDADGHGCEVATPMCAALTNAWNSYRQWSENSVRNWTKGMAIILSGNPNVDIDHPSARDTQAILHGAQVLTGTVAVSTLPVGETGSGGVRTDAAEEEDVAITSSVTTNGETAPAPYNRSEHYGNPATSKAATEIRQAGEGQPCPRCGQTMKSGTKTAPTAQHTPTLKSHYYSKGRRMTPAQRRAYARSAASMEQKAVCKTCQSKEGATESQK